MKNQRIALGMAIAFIIAMLPACAIIDRMSGVEDARELQMNGEPALAKILRIWDTGLTINNDPVVGFLLEVRRRDNPTYEVRTKLRISRLDIPRIQPGKTIPVRIDPRDPTRVTLDIYEYEKR